MFSLKSYINIWILIKEKGGTDNFEATLNSRFVVREKKDIKKDLHLKMLEIINKKKKRINSSLTNSTASKIKIEIQITWKSERKMFQTRNIKH